jgi:hypothetical protein
MILLIDRKSLDYKDRKLLAKLVREHIHDNSVRWGSTRKTIQDVLRVININRRRDGRENIDGEELLVILSKYVKQRSECLGDKDVGELLDALGCVREARLGVDKFRQYPTLTEAETLRSAAGVK